MEAREDIRYNSDAVAALVQAGLVSIPQYDIFLTQLVDANVSFNVVLFVMQLLQKLFIERSPMSKLVDVGGGGVGEEGEGGGGEGVGLSGFYGGWVKEVLGGGNWGVGGFVE